MKEGEVKPEIIRNIFGKNNLSIEKLIDEQNSDESIKQTILNLKENYEEATPDKGGFYLYKNILPKLKTSNLTPSPENSVLVLPSKLLANTIAHQYSNSPNSHRLVTNSDQILNCKKNCCLKLSFKNLVLISWSKQSMFWE